MGLRDDYIELYKKKHIEMNGSYGITGIKHKSIIQAQINELRKTRKIESVLDYGCGYSNLIDNLDVNIRYKYDPAIEQFQEKPSMKFDLVVCTDVLEHIPESILDDVINDIKSYSTHAIFVISTKTACHKLPNGENAHCTVYPCQWWIDKLNEHYSGVVHYDTKGMNIFIKVGI